MRRKICKGKFLLGRTSLYFVFLFVFLYKNIRLSKNTVCIFFFFKGKLKNPTLLIELEKNTFS